MRDDIFECNADDIFTAPNPCQYVQEYCGDALFNSSYLYQLYFCDIKQSNFLFSLIAILFLLTTFYLLASTSETYLSPALTKISKKLNLSETLAGVTLVAFANGAPDIISSFSAGESSEGVPLVIGSIFGGGVYISTAILAVVILASRFIEGEKFALLRDIGFYLLATVYVMIVGYVGYFNLVSAIGFVLLFPCYVIVVFVMERYQSSLPKPALSSSLLADSETMSAYSAISDPKTKPSIEMNAQFLVEQKSNPGPTTKKESLLDLVKTSERKDTAVTVDQSIIEPHLGDSQESRETLLGEMNRERRNRCWGCLNTFGKIARAYEAPFHLLRSLTIPAADEEQWNKMFAMIQPFTAIYFFLYVTNHFFATYKGFWIGLYLLPVQIIISLAVWRFTSSDQFPSRFETFFSIASLCFSIIWIYKAAVLTVEFLEFIGFITQLHPTFLGMSLLAWGNSMGDLFNNRALAKSGYGLMAMTGCFAGAVFNLLVGFGSSILRQVWNSSNHRVNFHIFNFDEKSVAEGGFLSMSVLVLTIINLSITLLYAGLKKFRFSTCYAIYLLVFYGIIFVFATMYSVHLKVNYAF